MQNDEKFPGLYFRDWPCQNVPIDEPVEVWADRAAALQQTTNLLEYLNSVDKTSLHLMWADLGCGKTHTMGFIRHLCLIKYKNIYPLYTLVPNRVASFLDQYKNIISAFDFDHLAEMTRRIIANNGENYLVSRVLGGSEEFHKVIKAISIGSSDSKSIGRRWLSGSTNLSKSELLLIGASKTIKNSDDALAILQGLSRIVIHSQPNTRLLIMVDEFQRLHESSDKISKNVGIGLHTFYNAVPRRLSILLSFACRKKENVDVILSRELKSRADTRSIQLPEMSRDDVHVFIQELFDAYRIKKKPPTVLFPLQSECVPVVIDDIVARKELVCPREISKRIDRLLDMSLSRLRDGVEPVIAAKEARELLSSIEKFD
jgi:hypothetical protein